MAGLNNSPPIKPMKKENKTTVEISESAKREAVAIATAYGKLDKRAINWRAEREREGFNSRQLALAFGWSVSLVNSTDNRTLCAVKGLGDVTAADAAQVIRNLGGMKAARDRESSDFRLAFQQVEKDAAAAKSAKVDKGGDKANGGLTPDERVMAAIAANLPAMTAAGRAAAIAALS